MSTAIVQHCIARLLGLLLVLQVAVSVHSGRLPSRRSHVHHECAHDKIAAEELPFIRAAVGSYSSRGRYSRSSNTDNEITERNPEGSHLLEFTHIRITPFFVEPLDASIRDALTDPSGPLHRSIAVMSSLLQVRPLKSNLTLTPACQQTFTNGANSGTCMELSLHTKCGIFDVPDQFLGMVLVCDTAHDPETCREVGPNGEGVTTDFLLFIGSNQSSFCEGDTFAFSSSCAKDAYHRPTAGYINICAEDLPDSIKSEENDNVLYNVLLHELIHALGFSQQRFSDFHDGNLNFYDPRVTGTYNRQSIVGLQSPKVLEVGRSYFGCTELPFVPLENNGENSAVNSHWEARVLHHESMVAYVSKDYSVLSNFTLAFFEDSGWYKVNYSSLEDLHQFDLLWGKGLGCPFVLQQCSVDSYPYLCDTDQTYQCTFDLVSRGKCTNTHTYFDGCPVVLPADEMSSCIIHHSNSTGTNVASEMFGQSSICIDIGLISSVSSNVATFPFCYNYQYCTNDSTSMQHDLKITAYNESVFCNSSTVSRTSHEIIQKNGRVKVYCPRNYQLNVRLALAGQATYLVEKKAANDVQTTVPPGMTAPTWLGIFMAIVAVLVVMVGFGLPLLLIAIKTLDCGARRRGHHPIPRHDCISDPNVISVNLSKTSSNVKKVVFV